MKYQEIARKTIHTEMEGLRAIAENLNGQFDSAVENILAGKGKLIVSGMGKSGQIGQKIASTLASTGTSAFFLHPAEALHGDLGMIEDTDILLLLSNSGETEEILRLLAYLKEHGNLTIAITGELRSTLARHADIILNAAVPAEACPLQLAPTTSTTAALVLGDALAVALMEARHFEVKEFARYHPGGKLGHKLLTTVGEAMRSEELPFVNLDIKPEELLIRMSEGRLGLALIGTAQNLEGIITDGDFRRGLLRFGSMKEMDLEKIVTRKPVVVEESMPLSEVEALMKERKITTVPVCKGPRITGVYQIFN